MKYIMEPIEIKKHFVIFSEITVNEVNRRHLKNK